MTPLNLQWVNGGLPDPKHVPTGSQALAWLVFPDGSYKVHTLGPYYHTTPGDFAWCDEETGFPLENLGGRVAYYAWLELVNSQGLAYTGIMEDEEERCHLCGRVLDDPNDKSTEDCGGDCLRCMADVGDPECVKRMKEIDSSYQEKS